MCGSLSPDMCKWKQLLQPDMGSLGLRGLLF